jgi:hypothetical protein
MLWMPWWRRRGSTCRPLLFTFMLANDVWWSVDGATAKARWLACKMEHENMPLAGEDAIVHVIEGMGQQVGWMMHPHAISVHEEEDI